MKYEQNKTREERGSSIMELAMASFQIFKSLKNYLLFMGREFTV